MKLRDFFRLTLLLAMIVAGRIARDAERVTPQQSLLPSPKPATVLHSEAIPGHLVGEAPTAQVDAGDAVHFN